MVEIAGAVTRSGACFSVAGARDEVLIKREGYRQSEYCKSMSQYVRD